MSLTSDVVQRMMAGAASTAKLVNYAFPDRVALLGERLSLNIPELSYLATLTGSGKAHYAASAVHLRSQGITPPADTGGIAALARRLRNTPSDTATAALSAHQRAQQQHDLNAFIQLASADELAHQASAAQASFEAGQALPLLGVPVAVKDLMAVQGFRLTGGSQSGSNTPNLHDALAVSRLRQAGAIMLGTTNLHELAFGITSRNPHYGAVVNPRNPAHIPGGSSGGSAAAVAAGIVRASIGTDTAGSIRIPAACCGVVGFKPSYDVIPRQGAMDLGPSLDHLGPITASVDDAALLFSIMAGLPGQVPQRLRTLQGIQIGVPTHYFFEPLAPEVRRHVNAAIALMEADGATVHAIDLPGVEYGAALQLATLCSEATAVHWDRLVHCPETLGEDVRIRLEIGQLFPAIWYTRAQGARSQLAAGIATAMAGIDVLAVPTLRTTAPENGADTVSVDGHDMPLHAAVTSLTLPFNLTGMPAISLPCGNSDHGLPVGIQLAAAQGHDWKMLAIAARLEQLLSAGKPSPSQH
ncbi:amidase [Allopusillimonas ginsengisoli]|uniref:amidase n=1 Tax=Allopusillimonas ginsengisoli TaxID=453575 RepID=UPI001021E581|nr:amidase [Allopusillimonas ginsengisoli]TEA80244.1 amidase [Allopusillimonas ginsengisoli]